MISRGDIGRNLKLAPAGFHPAEAQQLVDRAVKPIAVAPWRLPACALLVRRQGRAEAGDQQPQEQLLRSQRRAQFVGNRGYQAAFGLIDLPQLGDIDENRGDAELAVIGA